MEVKLNDNSRVLFEFTKSGVLSLQLLRPGHRHDGHGLLLMASTMLEQEEQKQLMDFLSDAKG